MIKKKYRFLKSVFVAVCAAAATLSAGLIEADAQALTPLLDCVEYNENRLEVTAYFGYSNASTTAATVPIGENNVFTPPPGFRGQITEFQPGFVRRAFQVTFRVDQTPTITWVLLNSRVSASNDPSKYCSRPFPFIYQGRLTDGDAAANGTYDMQFELYADAAGGTALETLSVEDVAVTNGTFTVKVNFTKNPFVDFSARYLAISVRPGASSDAFTALAPRQELTNAPYATVSVNALDAQKLGGYDISNFVLRSENGNLSVTGGIAADSGAPDGTNGYTFRSDGDSGVFNPADGQVSIYTNNSERLRVTDGGVGIGGIAPQQLLSVANGMNIDQNNLNNGTVTNTLRFGSSSGEAIGSKRTAGGNQFGLDFYTASTSRMSISVGGLVSIFNLGAAGSTQLCRNANNEIASCSSSLRYKTNIAPFSSGLSLINRLRPISFDWTNGGFKDIGFGAEDVAAINPLFVNYNSAGQIEGVKYDRLSVVFVNAFKEQQSQLEAQKEQLERQQQQIEQQKILINELKQLVCLQNPEASVCKVKN